MSETLADKFTMKATFEFPESVSMSTLVSLDSRKGTWAFFFWVRAMMHLPRAVRLVLIEMVSLYFSCWIFDFWG